MTASPKKPLSADQVQRGRAQQAARWQVRRADSNAARRAARRRASNSQEAPLAPEGAVRVAELMVETRRTRRAVQEWLRSYGFQVQFCRVPGRASQQALPFALADGALAFRAFVTTGEAPFGADGRALARVPRVVDLVGNAEARRLRREKTARADPGLAPEGAVEVRVLAAESGVTPNSVKRWALVRGFRPELYRPGGDGWQVLRSYLTADEAWEFWAWRGECPSPAAQLLPLAAGERGVSQAAAEVGVTVELLSKWLKRHLDAQVASSVPGAGLQVTDAALDLFRASRARLNRVSLPMLPSAPADWVPVGVLAGESGRLVTTLTLWLNGRGFVRAWGPPRAGRCRSGAVVSPETAAAFRAWARLNLRSAEVSARKGVRPTGAAPVPDGWLSLPEAMVFCGCSQSVLVLERSRPRHGVRMLGTVAGVRYDPVSLQAVRALHLEARPPAGWLSLRSLCVEHAVSRHSLSEWFRSRDLPLRTFKPEGHSAELHVREADAECYRAREPSRSRTGTRRL